MGGRVTLADVAAAAGVSRSTASLVVRGSETVADETRKRVLAAMKQMGYVYHRGAASLRMRRSGAVGVAIATLRNPFYAELTLGIEAELGPAGYVTLLANTFDDARRQDTLVRSLVEYQVDGILLVPAPGTKAGLVEWLQTAGAPLVLMTRGKTGGAPATYIGSDNLRGGRMAAEHLLGHGCADVVYLGGSATSAVRGERVDGVRSALEEAGQELRGERTWCSEISIGAGRSLGQQILAEDTLPDGVICHSDSVAFGFMAALRAAGVRGPAACRVIGFDDVEPAEMWDPPLTSVSVMAHDMGRRAARLFLERVSDPTAPLANLIIEPRLAVRQSCGCPAS